MDFDSFIEKNKNAYDIFRLHQQGKTYKELGQQLNLSTTRVAQLYRKFLYSVARYYYHSLKSEDNLISTFDLHIFYENPEFVIVYYENKYKQKLDKLRNGKPPLIPEMPSHFPAYRKLTEKELLEYEKKIIKAVSFQHRSYNDIAKELDITSKKAQILYKQYIRKITFQIIDKIKLTVDYDVEKYICSYSNSPFKRWELIVSKYPDFAKSLLQSTNE